MMTSSESVFARLRALNIPLPPTIRSQGAYDLVVVHGGLASVSGQLPRLDDDGRLISGRLAADADLALARDAARLCFARALLALHVTLGDLARVERLVSIRGFINAVPEFQRHGGVMDAASELALDLFGDAGRHVRSALGAGGLPAGALVEVEVVAALAVTEPRPQQA